VSEYVLSKMVSVIFAVLEVSFWGALTTIVKLPWKFLTLIFAVLLQFFVARCYASVALYNMWSLSICLPVCLSRSYMHSVSFCCVLTVPTHRGMAQAELTWVPGSVPGWFTCPKMVSLTGSKWAPRRVTTLIETNALALSQTNTSLM